MNATHIAKECPRWPTCSVNNCPLDEEYPNRRVDPADKERRCTMEKGVRLRIAATAPGTLTLSGLTVAEAAAKKVFESKPLAVRLSMAEQCKSNLAAHRKDKQATL